MKKRHVIIPILFLIILIIGSFILLFYIFGSLEKDKETKITPEFLVWFNSTSKEYDFNHPYVACILNKTCNGTFQFEIDVDEKNLSSLMTYLNKYGKIKGEYSNGLTEYTILFETDDIYKINNFLSLTQKININKIESSYKINISLGEMKKCQNDRECIEVINGCCGCNNEIINKKYTNLWKSQFYCGTTGCTSIACISNPNLICEQNICIEVDIMKCNTDNDCISGEEDCINYALTNRLGYSITDTFNCKCEENKCTGTLKKPIIVNITFPLNNSVITTNEIYINATTNKSVICEYTTQIKKGGSLMGTDSKQMNITNALLHSQLLGDLQNSGYYTVQLDCADGLGNSGKASVNFLSRINDYLNISRAHGLNTKVELPILLNSGLFQYSNGPDAQYSPILFLGFKPITNSTSNGDLEFPTVLIEVGTNYTNYLYKYHLIFSREINLTKNDGGEWWIELLGDNYKIADGSTNKKIILKKDFSEDNFILENEQPLKINDRIINGTYVKFNEGYISMDFIIGMDIYFAMQNSTKDYIAVGESYDNPFFQNIRYYFKSYSQENGAEIYFGQI